MATTEITLWDVTPNDGSDAFVVGAESKGAAENVASEWLAESGEAATMFTVANSGSRGPEPQMAVFVEQRKLARASGDLANATNVTPITDAAKRTAAGKEAAARRVPNREAKPDPKPAAKRGGKAKASGKPSSKASTKASSTARASAAAKREKASAKPAAEKRVAAAADSAGIKSTPADRKPRIGAKLIATDVLKANGGAMHTRDIVSGILADPRSSGLKGKTPAATIAAMLAVSAKKGDTFKRTAPGTFDLIER